MVSWRSCWYVALDTIEFSPGQDSTIHLKLDETGRIVNANETVQKEFNYSPEELAGSFHFQDLFAQPASVRVAFEDFINSDKASSPPRQFLAKSKVLCFFTSLWSVVHVFQAGQIFPVSFELTREPNEIVMKLERYVMGYALLLWGSQLWYDVLCDLCCDIFADIFVSIHHKMEAVLTADANGIIISCNDTFRPLFGYNKDELIGTCAINMTLSP